MRPLLLWSIRLLTALAIISPVHAADPSPPERRPPPDAQQRQQRPGPWDNDVLVYKISSSGVARQITTFERAGVATVARLKDNRLIAAHQHFPAQDDANFDKVAVRFSTDEGSTWTAPKVIQMHDLPAGMRFPFDPTLVPLPDGRVRLYFTSVRGRRIDEQPPAIYSGISTNGIDYVFEPGVRFAVEGRIVIDCAVALHNGVFHLYAPDNGARRPRPPDGGDAPQPPEERPRSGVAYHATSRDGLEFTRRPDVTITGRNRWLGNAESNGHHITFYGTGELPPPNPRTSSPTLSPTLSNPGPPGVWRGTSEDGINWKFIDPLQLRGADPGAVTLRDGTLLIVATGPPRPGTPSAERRPRRPPP